MKKFTVFCGIALLLPFATLRSTAFADERSKPEVRNYTTPGNLESTHNIGCISLAGASTEFNPIDLYRGAKVCLSSERYDEAFDLVSLASAYGRFDMLRVKDATAHQAVIVGRMEVFADIPDTAKAQFSEIATKNLSDPLRKTVLCRELRRLGAPTYKPVYMIQHGMMAFARREGDGLVKDFDRDSAWSEVLASYLKCP